MRHGKRLTLAVAVVTVGALFSPAASGAPATSQRTTMQPGAHLYLAEDSTPCTTGFLVSDPSGAVYALESVYCAPIYAHRDGIHQTLFLGARSWPVGKGPAMKGYSPDYRQVGRMVLQVAPDNTVEPAYSVMRLDPGIRYDGTLAVISGPFRRPFRGETTDPTAVHFVCGDRPVAQGVYTNGAHDDEAPVGVRRGVFYIADAVDQACQGAPMVAFDGSMAVGIVQGNATSNPDASALGGSELPTSRVHRVDAVLDDAARRMHTSLTLLQSGVKGRTTR